MYLGVSLDVSDVLAIPLICKCLYVLGIELKVILEDDPLPFADVIDSNDGGTYAELPASIERYLANPCSADEVFTLDTAIIKQSQNRKL